MKLRMIATISYVFNLEQVRNVQFNLYYYFIPAIQPSLLSKVLQVCYGIAHTSKHIRMHPFFEWSSRLYYGHKDKVRNA